MVSDGKIFMAQRELKFTIEEFGPASEEAKSAAVRLCNLHDIDPFTRYPVRVPLPPPDIMLPDVSETLEMTVEHEWQRLIRRVTAPKP